MKQILQRRWVRIVLVCTILLALILVLLPYGIRYGIQRALLAGGAEKIELRDIDLNLFTGTFSVNDLEIYTGDKKVLRIPHVDLKLGYGKLLSKHLLLNKVHISGNRITVEQLKDGRWKVHGLSPLGGKGEVEEKEEVPSVWAAGISELEVTDTQIRYISPALKSNFKIDRLFLTGLDSLGSEQPAHLSLQGKIDDALLRVEAEIIPVEGKRRMKSDINLSSLTMKPFLQMGNTGLTESDGLLHIDTVLEASQVADSEWKVMQKGSVRLEKIKLNGDFGNVANQEALWNGKITAEIGGPKSPSLSADGKVESQALEFLPAHQDLAIQNAHVSWEGHFEYGQPEQAPWGMDGGIALKGLKVSNPKQKLVLLAMDAMESEKIQAQGMDELKIAEVLLQNLTVGRRSDEKGEKDNVPWPLFGSQRIEISDIQFSRPVGVQIASMKLHDIQSRLQRNKDGTLDLVQELMVPKENEEKKEKEKEPAPVVEPAKTREENPMIIRLSKLEVAGDSRVRFEDLSVSPPFRSVLKIDKMVVSDIASAESEQPIAFELAAKLEDYSALSLTGKVKPFAKKMNLQLTGTVKAYDLPPLSSYASPALGYNLKSGHMDTDFETNIVEGKIQGEVKLVISKLELKPKNKEKMAQLTTRLAMPLDVALQMLRDKKNIIRLKVPISGDTADPKFDISDAINRAMGTAMKMTAISLLKNSLQPYGTMITVAEIATKAGKKAMVRLDPVYFEPGQATLDEKGDSYLKKVGDFMKDKPQLTMRICGFSVPDDRKTLFQTAVPDQPASTESVIIDEQLLELARSRSVTVKDLLVSQSGLEADRLFICNPELDLEENNQPRADLLL